MAREDDPADALDAPVQGLCTLRFRPQSVRTMIAAAKRTVRLQSQPMSTLPAHASAQSLLAVSARLAGQDT